MPLAVELWIDLPEFGGYLRNVAKNQFGCKIDSGVDIATFDNSLELPSENLEIVHRIGDWLIEEMWGGRRFREGRSRSGSRWCCTT